MGVGSAAPGAPAITEPLVRRRYGLSAACRTLLRRPYPHSAVFRHRVASAVPGVRQPSQPPVRRLYPCSADPRTPCALPLHRFGRFSPRFPISPHEIPGSWTGHDGFRQGRGGVIAPACLRNSLGFDTEVVGSFTVCPFSHERPGEMQLVCVQAVKDAVVESARVRGQQLVKRKLPDCSLPE